MRVSVNAPALLILGWSAAAAATPPCEPPDGTFEGLAPLFHDPLPTNVHLFTDPLDDAAWSLRNQGVDIALLQTEHSAYLEHIPADELPQDSEIEVLRDGEAYTTFTTGPGPTTGAPGAPRLRDQLEGSDYCPPAMTVRLREQDDAVLLIARFDEPPSTDAPAEIATQWDSLHVVGDEGTTRTLFVVAIGAAGNQSEPLAVDVTFREPSPWPSCAHHTATPSRRPTFAVFVLVVLAGARAAAGTRRA